MDMYIWEVRVEVEYITRWRDSNDNEESETWTEEEGYTVASPLGLGAYDKAKNLAREFEAYDNADDREENEPIKTTAFNRVTDLVYLSLKETLDG